MKDKLINVALISGAVIIGIVVLRKLFADLWSGLGAGFQAAWTNYSSGTSQGAFLVNLQTALNNISVFPRNVPIPLTGSTAGDLYDIGYTTDDIKAMILDYGQNYASDQTGQNNLLYQLGQAIGQSNYEYVTP